jgi:hypothetical protein
MIIGIIINSYNMKNDWEKKATCSAYLSTIIKQNLCHLLTFIKWRLTPSYAAKDTIFWQKRPKTIVIRIIVWMTTVQLIPYIYPAFVLFGRYFTSIPLYLWIRQSPLSSTRWQFLACCLLFSIVFHILWIYDDAYDHFR